MKEVKREDITKAKKMIRWEPRYKLEDGLKKTIEWFRVKMKSLSE